MLTNESEIKILKWMTWGFFFLMLGFLSSPTLVSLYHILFVVPAIIILIKGPKFKYPLSSLILIALFLWGLTSNFVNLDTLIKPNRAFQELKFYLFGVLFLPAFAFYFAKRDIFQVHKFVKIVSVVVIIAFFVGISKAWLGFDPIKMKTGNFHIRSGGFTNYMRYGYASAFLFLLSLGAYLNRSKIKRIVGNKLFLTASFLCLAAIGTSQTRGAILALLVGTPFLLLKYKPLIGKILIFLGVSFVSTVVYFSFINSGVTKHRFLNINQSSNNVRMSQFLSAKMAIQDNKIFGLGGDQFSYNVKAIKIKYDIWAKRYSGHAHNIFLEHGANFGIPGMILILFFFLAWFIEMVKRKDDLGWVIASYTLAFVASGQVENLFDNTNSHLLFFIYSFSQVYGKNNYELECV